MRKFKVSLLGLVSAFAVAGLAGCGQKGDPTPTIWVGNTAATSGAYAGVGVPFNAAIKARFHAYNEAGGFRGNVIKLKHYDDQFLASEGLTLTKRLVEDDKVFALVGHFGTNTVGATLNYIKEQKVPMVYAATGINALYTEKEVGSPVFSVQPIYKTEGRVMVARAYGEPLLFGKNPVYDPVTYAVTSRTPVDKVAVFYTADDAGRSILEGIEDQMAKLGRANKLVKVEGQPGAQDYAAQVTSIKNDASVDVIIAAVNQNPFKTFLAGLAEQNVERPVITSYVNANITEVNKDHISATRPVYANAWVDVYSDGFLPAFATFTTIMKAALDAEAITADEHSQATVAGFAYGLAGYIAAETFLAGLRAVDTEKELTRPEYIKALEKAPIDLPFTNGVDFSGGKRWGIEQLVLTQRVVFPVSEALPEGYDGFIKARNAEPLDTIVGRVAAL